MFTYSLRPGLLVSLKTSISGNVSYVKTDIEADHLTENGERHARWETERTVADAAEHEAAMKTRNKARSLITGVCAASTFGLLCPESLEKSLNDAITEAIKITEKFNETAQLTRVNVYVVTGKIVPDDIQAVRAINSEVRELLGDMERGIKNLDVKSIRDAADKARDLGAMLSPDAAARVKEAIEAARGTARKLVKAAEQGAQAVDELAIRKITEARTAFLDIGDTEEVETPEAEGRAIDLEPSVIAQVEPQRPAFELE